MPLVNVMVNNKAYTRSIGPEKCEAQRSGFPGGAGGAHRKLGHIRAQGRATKKIGATRCR
jgi:hypothetical protein